MVHGVLVGNTMNLVNRGLGYGYIAMDMNGHTRTFMVNSHCIRALNSIRYYPPCYTTWSYLRDHSPGPNLTYRHTTCPGREARVTLLFY
jgi:hypothetical protein